MFLFGNDAAKQKPEFVPDAEAQSWIGDVMSLWAPRLGRWAASDVLITQGGNMAMPKSFDGLFELLCSLQSVVGQSDLEFTLSEMQANGGGIPKGFEAIGDPSGHLLHSFVRGEDEFLMVASPALFKSQEVLGSSVAREIGRLSVFSNGGSTQEPKDLEGENEIVAIMLGLGVWIANGAYMFENKCCGGGCGVNLSSLRTGLSMNEACYAIALDGQRRGLSRRNLTKFLSPTQSSALKQSWKAVAGEPKIKQLAESVAQAQISA